MIKIMAIVYFLTALAGCSGEDRSIMTRSSVNGVDQIYSKVHIRAGTTTFACLDSISGSCHYAIFDCALGHCQEQPLRMLAVVAGTEQDVRDLPATIQVCARGDDTAQTVNCLRPQ
ncbi:hypothetical protein [Dyella sp.]|uniref:hypothetical protein n=1 Tax=Dyella sp. TaxID=1869338 RepID=UPI002ED08940